jgi:hypothetical protein
VGGKTGGVALIRLSPVESMVDVDQTHTDQVVGNAVILEVDFLRGDLR